MEPQLKSSPNDKMLSSFKKGQYTYSNPLTYLETIILWFFGGSFAIWGNGATIAHPSTWIYIHQHMSNYKISTLYI